MTAPFLFLFLRRQRALRESMALPCSAPRGEFVRGWQPLRLLIWALRPSTPGGFMRSWELLRPLIWALRPKPRVTFPSRGKSPKARQGLCPLESPEGSAKLWEPDAVRFEGWNVSPIELKAITIPYRPFRARLRIAPGCLLPQNKTDLPL